MKQLVAILLFISVYYSVSAQISMPQFFSNHMVLQREAEIPVWGEAFAGTEITVEFNGHQVSTTTDINGQWIVKLPAEQAGGPFALKITENGLNEPSLVFTDVMVGDVWLASGQSNMEWQVQQSLHAETEVPKATHPNLRYFFVPHNISLTPLDDVRESSWQRCDSNTVKSMSAVAYYFSRKLQQELDIPVGILQTTWGGTPVEAWTSRESLLKEPSVAMRVHATDTLTEQHFSQDSLDLIKFWEIVYQPQHGSDTIYSHPEFNDENWAEVTIPGVISNWYPKFYEGIIWLRKQIELSESFTGKELTINLGAPEMNYSLYVNGHEICKTQWNANLSHSYPIPKEFINNGTNTIALRIAALWGGGGIHPPADNIYLTDGNENVSLTGKWKFQKDLETAIPRIYNYQYYPSMLYNAMLHPLVPYGIKGVIWYQGEANDSVAYNYRNLFPALINDWREKWQQEDLPFLWVQLPNYMKREDQPTDGLWAVMRESQAKTLELPNTGMACIIDLGEADNIHPKEKKEVGRRLGYVALKNVYHEKILAAGPVLQKYRIEEDQVILQFNVNGERLETSDGKKITGFAVAGENQQFYWAEAKIEGNRVMVSSPYVEHPVAVRYAWANNPACNLVNDNGLPAQPFRTDTWKVVTQKSE